MWSNWCICWGSTCKQTASPVAQQHCRCLRLTSRCMQLLSKQKYLRWFKRPPGKLLNRLHWEIYHWAPETCIFWNHDESFPSSLLWTSALEHSGASTGSDCFCCCMVLSQILFSDSRGNGCKSVWLAPSSNHGPGSGICYWHKQYQHKSQLSKENSK